MSSINAHEERQKKPREWATPSQKTFKLSITTQQRPSLAKTLRNVVERELPITFIDYTSAVLRPPRHGSPITRGHVSPGPAHACQWQQLLRSAALCTTQRCSTARPRRVGVHCQCRLHWHEARQRDCAHWHASARPLAALSARSGGYRGGTRPGRGPRPRRAAGGSLTGGSLGLEFAEAPSPSAGCQWSLPVAGPAREGPPGGRRAGGGGGTLMQLYASGPRAGPLSDVGAPARRCSDSHSTP